MKNARRFVPARFDAGNFEQIHPLTQELLDRPIENLADLECWLLDFSELSAVLDEYYNRRYIDKTCHTDDEQIQRAFLHFVEIVEPQYKPVEFALKKRFVDSPHRAALAGPRYAMLSRNWEAETSLFRDKNVPLETQVTKTANEYDRICGAMTVSFRGQTLTMPQMGRFQEDPDRQTRQDAFMAANQRRLEDRESIEALFEQLLPLRHEIALNAGEPDFRAYCWKQYKRFDYSPDDCLRFGESVAECVMPIKRELARQRAADLKIDRLRPWDLAVDPRNRPALRPYDSEKPGELVDAASRAFHRVSEALGEQFDSLRSNGNLDLESRKGKAPGGYQSFLAESLQPFIFMNASGLHRDVVTLLHEGGHAFHSLAAKDEPLHFLRHAPIEFCEVASMSMELLGADHLEEFYKNPTDVARARRQHLEGIINVLTWIATIDGFQHWLYTHPGHSRAQRADAWLDIFNRFDGITDWDGLDSYRASYWQRQLHLFSVPFYYIEYGIAQLGALQLWMKSRHDPRQALSSYRAALKLGGTRSLPHLFNAAGIRFDFTSATIRPLMNALQDELAELTV